MLDLLIFTSSKKAFSINNESLENPIVGGINTYTWEIHTMCMYNCTVHVLYMSIDLTELTSLHKQLDINCSVLLFKAYKILKYWS